MKLSPEYKIPQKCVGVGLASWRSGELLIVANPGHES